MSVRGPAIALVALGLAQMLGDALAFAPLRGLAAATAASPAPHTSSSAPDLATRFFIEWRDTSGVERSHELTPEAYARIQGPSSRRAAYGAIVAYGPMLASSPDTRRLAEDVARYALCGDARMLRELAIDPKLVSGRVRARIDPASTADDGDRPLVFEARCP